PALTLMQRTTAGEPLPKSTTTATPTWPASVSTAGVGEAGVGEVETPLVDETRAEAEGVPLGDRAVATSGPAAATESATANGLATARAARRMLPRLKAVPRARGPGWPAPWRAGSASRRTRGT